MKSFFLNPCEQIMFTLGELYERNGYTHYKMSKFEEYDFYANHKDFLISENVLTFTDTNGKLMALKPDVTLSIVKNARDDIPAVQKVYYHESVYRVSKGSNSFRELMQTGLEAIGNVDGYTVFEVLRLAGESLLCLKNDCVLELSHLGILSELLDTMNFSTSEKLKAIRLFGEKNRHGLELLCRDGSCTEDAAAVIQRLSAIHGTPAQVLPEVRRLLRGYVCEETLSEFAGITLALDSIESLRGIIFVDFSAVDDLNYYNGFVFKGFTRGVPDSVISGGQYDTLMKKMGRKSGAVGFAVYPDRLEQLFRDEREYDVDTLVLYNRAESPEVVSRVADRLRQSGETVLVQSRIPKGLVCRRTLKIVDGEVKVIAENA